MARPAGTEARGGRLVLASRSPRRRLLLTDAGIDHDVVDTGIDDADLEPGDVSPAEWAASLAYLKARAGAALGGGADRPVLGADTVCVKDGGMIGQPVDAADARRILQLFEDGEHDVITGVALVSRTRRELRADRARVHVGRIGQERLEEYVAGGGWRGKAGAYNLSERLEAGWPIRYEGDPTTVMGLPMRLLETLLPPSGQGAPAAGR